MQDRQEGQTRETTVLQSRHGSKILFHNRQPVQYNVKEILRDGGLGHLEEVRVEGLHCDLVQAGVVHADHVLVEPA